MVAQEQQKPFVIGLDLGGTNSVFGIVDQRGNILTTNSIKTQAYKTAEDFVSAGVEALKPIIAKVGGIEQIKAMGIGAPNAAAIGEMQYGVARGMKNFIMITLGTGVGSGIVVDGHMVYGSDGFAGELGHTIIRRENGRPCGCGRKGCLETYCSATGVARTAREFLATSDEPSLLREMNPEEITSLDVSIAASKGDALANRIYEFTGQILGEACSDFMAFSSPEAFVFFGGLTKAGDLLMKPLKKAYDENVLKIYKDKAQFLISSLDDASAAVLGASAIGWEL